MTAASRLPNPTAKKKKLVCRIASRPRKEGRRRKEKEGGKKATKAATNSVFSLPYPAVSTLNLYDGARSLAHSRTFTTL